MKIISLFLVFIILFMNSMQAVEALALNFELLKDGSFLNQIEGQKIKIRGFLFPLDSNCSILSAEPHLKTCCIGSKDKQDQQILLSGSFEKIPRGQSVEFEGIFIIDRKNENVLYRLLQPSLIENKKNSMGLFLAAIGISFVIGLFLKKQSAGSTENSFRRSVIQ